tara:strand:+ start:234 stop:647 length:414 start_codon:yes stop_codon:yes gene_type:complete
MTTISKAISALGITEWVLRGEPTSEAEFNAMFRKVTGEDSNGSAIESSDPKDFGTTWKAVSDKKKELEDAEPMRLLRVERDRLLAETDWTALGDVTQSSDMKSYRTKLRDLPASAKPKLDSNGALDMSSVTFPTKPS